jgi:hypothetical protein
VAPHTAIRFNEHHFHLALCLTLPYRSRVESGPIKTALIRPKYCLSENQEKWFSSFI